MGIEHRLSRDHRRIDILHRAVRAFGKTNFHRTTTKTVAIEAGISEALLFQHFKNKEDLFVETLRQASQELNDQLERILSDHVEDPLAAFAKAYIYFYDHLNRFPGYGRLVLSALADSGDERFRGVLEDNIARAESILLGGIQRGIDAGVFRKDVNLELVRWIFVSGYHYMIVARQLGRLPEANAELMQALLKPILADPIASVAQAKGKGEIQ
ncbi:MAG: TetR/AcrR family transcriptional regulator [Nitrospirae bacterium]|nr:TetR/AcrR family transcriptional regulator [Nitrospirota bacterium]